MPSDPHWTAYLSALLTPLVAVLGAFIAYRQWRLGQNKLKLDLFDRRFSVYSTARNLLAHIIAHGNVSDEELMKFLAGTREAKWLLDPAVDQYLDKTLYHSAVDLQTLEKVRPSLPNGDERSKNIQNHAELLKWFLKQYDALDKQFGPFLRLGH